MNTINIEQARKFLNRFEFTSLFTEALGWNHPDTDRERLITKKVTYYRREVATLGGAMVFQVRMTDGAIPDSQTRELILRDNQAERFENITIFTGQ